MILGIDEYWTENEMDENTNFTMFKKFSQRAQKNTGNKEYKYLQEIEHIFEESGTVWQGDVDTSKVHPDKVSHVYIYGHSLGTIDRDVLSVYIKSDATAVTIYCFDKGAKQRLFDNTIRLVGEKRLREKLNCVPTKLEYIIQKEPVECSTP